MKIRHSNRFRKDLRVLSREQKKAVAVAIRCFSANPFDPSLENHKLKGKMKGMRAISAGFDLRIIYREEGDHVLVLMLRVGSHGRVY